MAGADSDWSAARDGGYDEEFDYAGKDLVAPARYLRGMRAGKIRGYTGTPQGQQRVGAATEAVVAGLQARAAGGRAGMGRAMGVWRTMGDKRVRTHVLGLHLRENRASRELVAYVDASVWMHEFSMMAPAYLQEWNHRCAACGLDMQANKLTFRLSSYARAAGQTGAVKVEGEKAEKAPAPLTPEELERVERSVASIGNESLRRKAYETMKSVLSWEKATKSKNGA